jgi:hypothetical protein
MNYKESAGYGNGQFKADGCAKGTPVTFKKEFPLK